MKNSKQFSPVKVLSEWVLVTWTQINLDKMWKLICQVWKQQLIQAWLGRSCWISVFLWSYTHSFISIWTTFLWFCCVHRTREVRTFSTRPENTSMAVILSLDQQSGIRGRAESAFLWVARLRYSQINSSVISFIIHAITAILFGIHVSRGGVCCDGMFMIQIWFKRLFQRVICCATLLVPVSTLPFCSGLWAHTSPASPRAAKWLLRIKEKGEKGKMWFGRVKAVQINRENVFS